MVFEDIKRLFIKLSLKSKAEYLNSYNKSKIILIFLANALYTRTTDLSKTGENVVLKDEGQTLTCEEPETVKADLTEESHTEENSVKTKAHKRGKKTAASYAIEFFIKVGVTAVVIVVLCVFVIGIHVNHGNSSYPMIKDGDLLITYKLSELQAGQEIAYKKDGEIRFARIVAMAGDEVKISDQRLMVNGYGIVEDTVYPTTAEGAAISFPYVVPDGTVFVLNDFRSDVNDSRTFGAIPLPDCEGEVVIILRRRGI